MNRVSAGGSARPTKADVARLAKVSTATVSYVLNNAEGRTISPRTREAVRRAAKELGYRPNLAARNLARGGSGVVLYVMPRVALGELPIEVGSRLTTALARRGIMHVLQFETDDGQNVAEAIADLDPIAVTSLFPLTSIAAEAVEAAGVPQIHLGSSQLDAIGTLHLSVGKMRVGHLVSRGHHRLAFAFSGAANWRPLGDYWLPGVQAAARDRDLPAVAVAEITARDAADVVKDWVDQGVTAVCAQSDDTALVVLHGVREAGLRCPTDLAVMGVDAIPAGEVSAPPLTTIRFDATAIVDVAVEAMMSELGYPESSAGATSAEVATLIHRAST